MSTLASTKRLHPFLTDVLTSAGTQAIVFVSQIVCVSLVSKSMGAIVLAEFLLLKRVSAWFLSGSQLGLGIALPREIAHNPTETSAQARQLFAAGFLFLMLFVGSVGVVAALAARNLGQFLFGSDDRHLVYALSLLLLGMAAEVMLFGYYRGLQHVQTANIIQIVTLAASPMAAILALRHAGTAAGIIALTGITILVFCSVWTLPIIMGDLRFISNLHAAMVRLLSYGVSRVPGDLAIGAFLTVGPIFVTHYTDKTDLSYLLLGTTFLTTAGYCLNPLTLVLLAKISQLMAGDRQEDVRNYVGHLRSAVVQISLVAASQGLIFVRPIIVWWLGPAFVRGVPVTKIMLLAVPAYLYFVGSRSVIDAATPKALNTRNVVVAFTVFLVLLISATKVLPSARVTEGTAVATALAMYLLALLTERSLRDLGLGKLKIGLQLLALPFALAVVSLAVQTLFGFDINKPTFVFTELLNAGLAFVIFRRLRPQWLEFALVSRYRTASIAVQH